MVIVITGPTGVGKTKMGIKLAKKLDGEIINADSTVVYKGLDIATAKVTDMEGIIHHLIDIKEITKNYTVYDFQKDARACIADIKNRGKTPIMVGGTGLYIKAALYDYKFLNEENNTNYDDISNEELYNKLKEIDPDTEIHMNNRKRIIRALNYFEQSNEPYSLKEKTNKLLYDTIFIGLTIDRNILYERINSRVDEMVNLGLVEEAKKIYDSGIRTKAITTPIGYKELFPYFEGKSSLEECLDLIKKRTRNYAKRQYTWFNNQMDIKWFSDATLDEILDYIKKQSV